MGRVGKGGKTAKLRLKLKVVFILVKH